MSIINQYLKILALVCLLFFLMGIILFFWRVDLFDFSSEIDTEKFSHFGDYIGGILGTIFAGLSFILLILTYNTQREETSTNQQNQDLSYIVVLYDNIVSDINNLSYKEFKGLEALYNFQWDVNDIDHSVLNYLNSILFSFENLILVTQNSQFKNEEIRNITLTRVYFLYYTMVLWPVNKNIWSNFRKILIDEHDDSYLILEKYKILSMQTVNYLKQNKLVASDKNHINDIMVE